MIVRMSPRIRDLVQLRTPAVTGRLRCVTPIEHGATSVPVQLPTAAPDRPRRFRGAVRQGDACRQEAVDDAEVRRGESVSGPKCSGYTVETAQAREARGYDALNAQVLHDPTFFFICFYHYWYEVSNRWAYRPPFAALADPLRQRTVPRARYTVLATGTAALIAMCLLGRLRRSWSLVARALFIAVPKVEGVWGWTPRMPRAMGCGLIAVRRTCGSEGMAASSPWTPWPLIQICCEPSLFRDLLAGPSMG